MRLPFGHMAEHPLRLQLGGKGALNQHLFASKYNTCTNLEHGTVLSHFSFNLQEHDGGN